MFIYSRKIISAIAAICAAMVFTTACGNDKPEELSSSVVETIETVTENSTDEKSSDTAATEAGTQKEENTTEASAEYETQPPTDEKVETPSTDEPEISITIDPTMGQEQTTQAPVVQQPVVDTPAYNQDIKDKLGIEVVLTGSNEQQAQQYVDACKAAYPSLPWVNNGTWAGVDVSSLRSETSVDVWSLTANELDALINERLAGRDYHDLSIEELYALQDLTEGLSPLADEIGAYFNDLTSKDFNNGGYIIAE